MGQRHYYRGSQLVESKSNEIPAGRKLLERVDVTGCLIGVDALNILQDSGQQIVQGGWGVTTC